MEKTIGDNMVVFRSNQEFYKAEEDGRKPNTVRKIEEDDPRIKMLRDAVGITDYLICIVCVESNWCFVKKIKDYREYENLAIITWFEGD